jgi:hypothetical protein
MTCQLDPWLDADLTWMTGKGHGARIRGDDRWYLSSGDCDRVRSRLLELRGITGFM